MVKEPHKSFFEFESFNGCVSPQTNHSIRQRVTDRNSYNDKDLVLRSDDDETDIVLTRPCDISGRPEYLLLESEYLCFPLTLFFYFSFD